ncbi:hypothetical protein BJV82DRAFT_150387 [Fennellomyces sp. T-0311]|nr:hypothetical protein BJV82DRAFT_150387 [Fennellomyces sp. T-0311]
MDLRLLCIGTETEQDNATGKFGRHVKHSKYHKDKRKLAISAQSQLNAMIKNCWLSTQQASYIYVSTIEVLGTRANSASYDWLGRDGTVTKRWKHSHCQIILRPLLKIEWLYLAEATGGASC